MEFSGSSLAAEDCAAFFPRESGESGRLGLSARATVLSTCGALASDMDRYGRRWAGGFPLAVARLLAIDDESSRCALRRSLSGELEIRPRGEASGLFSVSCVLAVESVAGAALVSALSSALGVGAGFVPAWMM